VWQILIYINTNHPNFLGAAAAMSSIMQNKQDEERKAVLAEAFFLCEHGLSFFVLLVLHD
jgi:hypothetical protein